MVSAVFPTPPSPSTTNLYRVIFPCDMMIQIVLKIRYAQYSRVRGTTIRSQVGQRGSRDCCSLRSNYRRNVAQQA
jgi:hypothetical protein